MKQYTQKSMPLILLLVVSLLALAACSTGQATSSSNSTAPDNSSAAPVNPPSLNTPVGPANPAMATNEASLGDIVALAYNPADSSLFRADSQGLAKWQAETGWKNLAVSGATSLTGVVVNSTAPDNIYIAGPGLGVSRSDDGGANWQQINTGLPGLEVTALAMHSFRRETLYAWINSQGIYRTEDGGATWKKIPDVPITDPNVRGLTHSTLPGSMNTGWLYAATPSGTYLSMD